MRDSFKKSAPARDSFSSASSASPDEWGSVRTIRWGPLTSNSLFGSDTPLLPSPPRLSFFRNRRDAGTILVRALTRYADRDDVVVVGLPPGGVPVAYEVAKALHAPLDVLVVGKLAAPGHEDLTMGAVASGGVRVIEPDVVVGLNLSKSAIEMVSAREQRELIRRERHFRGDRSPVDVRDKTVILVDDGLTAGAAMRAAVKGLKRRNPGRVVVAIPVAVSSTCEALSSLVDEIVCASTPEPYLAVDIRYADVSHISDDEVRALLTEASRELAA